MKSCTKTHACARRTRKRVGRILTMGEAHGTAGKADQASRVEPARRLPFHAKPIPPCGTSHEEQPLMPCRSCSQGRTTPRKTATPHEPVAQTCGFYPAALFVSPLCQTHDGIACSTASQFGFWPAHSRGFNMRPTRGSISAPAKYIPPQRGAREQFRAFGNCCRKTLEYHS